MNLLAYARGACLRTDGPTVGEWLVDASPGKIQRLTYLCDLLGIYPPDIHYQLLHRIASALIATDRVHARDEAMAVRSSRQNAGGLKRMSG